MTERRDMSGRSSTRAAQLEERIREIESELGNVHDDMRLLRRVVDKPERNDIYPGYSARAAQAMRPPLPVPAIAQPTGPKAQSVQRPLVAVPPASPKDRRVAAAVARTDAAPQAQPELMTRDARDHERFASYFTTGSLKALQPLRRERRTQRNRAIVALAFLGVVLLWVLRLIF
ncbi:MAG: hypothetical protein WCL16_09245 [bacterium]